MDLKERTLRELKKKIHWSKKAVVINLFHNAMISQDSKWTLASTSNELKISKAYVSECINLANSLNDHPDMISMSRSKALKLIRG